MLNTQPLAIIVTDPSETISTWKNTFSRSQAKIGESSVLGRLLSQLAFAGVAKTIVLAQGTIGEIASDIGNDLNGMELCFKELTNPNPGRLIDAISEKEILDTDSELLIFTENVVIDFSVLEKLMNSSDQNVAVVKDELSEFDNVRFLTDGANRITAIDPSLASLKPTSGKSSIGIFKLEASLVRSIVKTRPCRRNDDLEFFSTALGAQTHPIHVMDAKPHCIMYVRDAVELEAANFAFSNSKDRFETIEKLHGGYWRYPVSEHVLLCNSHFPPAALLENIKARLSDLLHLYPSGHREIAAQVSEMTNLPIDFIAVGNGVSELIRALYGHLKPTIAIPTPTFIEYQNALPKDCVKCFELPHKTFDLDVHDFAKFAIDSSASAAVVVNPNNPTGRLVSPNDILILAKLLEPSGCRLIVDESFIDFSDAGLENSIEQFLSEHPNLIVLKSLGKTIGLGGARLGYLASANFQLVSEVRKRLALWNINGIAEYLLWILPNFRAEWEESFRLTRSDIMSFSRMLETISGFNVLPSQANYVFCKIPDLWPGASEAAYLLATEHSVLVRHCGYQSMQGGDRYLRLTARTEEENIYLISALRNVGQKFESSQNINKAHNSTCATSSIFSKEIH